MLIVGTQQPGPEIAREVAKLVERLGVSRASKILQVAREPVMRVAAGLPVRRGTLAQVEAALAKLGTGPRVD